MKDEKIKENAIIIDVGLESGRWWKMQLLLAGSAGVRRCSACRQYSSPPQPAANSDHGYEYI